MSQNSNESLYNGCMRWHHGSERWSSHVKWVIHRTEIHVCRVLPAPAPPWEQKQPPWKWHSPPKPREARAVYFLSQQLPRWWCQPRGELLGSCVWQSFLLEMCSKCLPCPRHWQYSRDTGEEYSLPCAWKLPLPCYVPRLLRPLVGSPMLCLSSPSLPFFISYVHISCGTAVLSAWGCLWLDSDL